MWTNLLSNYTRPRGNYGLSQLILRGGLIPVMERIGIPTGWDDDQGWRVPYLQVCFAKFK